MLFTVEVYVHLITKQKTSTTLTFKNCIKYLQRLFVGSLLTLLSIKMAYGFTLSEAKDNMWVGETLSGYLASVEKKHHLIPIDDISLSNFVSDINKKRQSAYEKLAEKNHLSTEIIAKLTAKKLIDKAPDMHFIKGINGQWTQKMNHIHSER